MAYGTRWELNSGRAIRIPHRVPSYHGPTKVNFLVYLVNTTRYLSVDLTSFGRQMDVKKTSCVVTEYVIGKSLHFKLALGKVEKG